MDTQIEHGIMMTELQIIIDLIAVHKNVRALLPFLAEAPVTSAHYLTFEN